MSFFMASLCTFLLAILLTLLVRKGAHRYGVVAAPRQDRWHKRPTALLGGVAIYAAAAAGYLLFGANVAGIWPILAGGSVLFVAGLIDDLYQLKPYTKLVIQLAVAAMVVYFGLRLPWTHYEAVDGLITVFWLVGITNAINLLDNMDGLAAGVSLISCAFLFVTFLVNGQPAEAMLAAVIGGAVAGFLVFNFNPASIFMGDGGSMFLGFVLGGTAMFSDYGRTRNLTAVLLTPVLILLIPIFDTCVVTATRKLSGRPVSQGGRDHTSHRLVALGMSERRAVLMLYLFAAMSGGLAMTVRLVGEEVTLLVIPAFALLIVFLGLYLGKVRVYEEDARVAENGFVRLLIDFSHKRRVFEVLLDVFLIALAYYGAYLLRFDGALPRQQMDIFLSTLPLVIVMEILVFLIGGVYRGLWRYTGVADLVVIGRATLVGGGASAALIFLIYQMNGPSRAVFILNLILLLLLVCVSRLAFRLFPIVMTGRRHDAHPEARPVLIYGAGDSGEKMIREIMNNSEHRMRPVGFIDDDARKRGKLIHGYRIFDIGEAPDLIRRYGVSDVLISTFNVSESRLDALRAMGVSLRRMSVRIE